MATLAPVIEITAKKSLFEIEDHLEALFASIDMIEDEALKREAEAQIDLYLQMEVRKVDSICGYLAHCEAQQKAAAEEIKRLQARKASYERNAERVELSVQRTMNMWGMSKLEGKTNTLLLRSCPPSVEVLDQSLVPPSYLRTTVTETVDKTAAKADLKNQIAIPGLVLVTDRKSVVRR